MQTIRLARAGWASFRQSGRDHLNKRPRLRWFLSALVWLPLGLFVTEYGFNVKSVKGRSMQVRGTRFTISPWQVTTPMLASLP